MWEQLRAQLEVHSKLHSVTATTIETDITKQLQSTRDTHAKHHKAVSLQTGGAK